LRGCLRLLRLPRALRTRTRSKRSSAAKPKTKQKTQKPKGTKPTKNFASVQQKLKGLFALHCDRGPSNNPFKPSFQPFLSNNELRQV
jgi:hypothetical protein